jgi:hypothetical protein
MRRGKWVLILTALLAVCSLAIYSTRHEGGPAAAAHRGSVAAGRGEPGPASTTGAGNGRAPAPSGPRSSKLAVLAAEIGRDAISPIANGLNAPGGDIHRDVEILHDVLVAWRTNFPQAGNPVGENDEITLALCGANPLHFAFIAPTHPAINARGELCDRWGTPFRFHAWSGTQMEIRSAGPDRRFATGDDVQFAPWGNPP